MTFAYIAFLVFCYAVAGALVTQTIAMLEREDCVVFGIVLTTMLTAYMWVIGTTVALILWPIHVASSF